MEGAEQERTVEIEHFKTQSEQLRFELKAATANAKTAEAEAIAAAEAALAEDMRLRIEKIQSAHNSEIENALAEARANATHKVDAASASASAAKTEAAQATRHEGGALTHACAGQHLTAMRSKIRSAH